MKQKSCQIVVIILLWLLFVLSPLLAKEPVTKNKEAVKEAPLAPGLPEWGEILVSPAGEQSIRFADNYTLDSLKETTHYVEWLDDGFQVLDGRLKAGVFPRQKAFLQVLPPFGNEFEFSIDVQYDGRPFTEAGFTLLINSGSCLMEPAAGFQIELHKARVRGWFQPESRPVNKDYVFKPQQWYTCKITCTNDILSLFINDEEQFILPLSGISESIPLPDNSGMMEGEVFPEEDKAQPQTIEPNLLSVVTGRDRRLAKAVNFSLFVEGKEDKNEISFDNLTVTGKAAPAGETVKVVKSRFLLGKREHQLAVLYAEGFEQWAVKQLAGSVKYLQHVYTDIYQFAPNYSNLGMVQLKKAYDFQNIKTLYGESIFGLQAGVPDEEDSINRYGLLRFWSAYYAESWMRESVPYFIFQLEDALAHKLVTLKDVHQQHNKLIGLYPPSREVINTFIEAPLSTSPLGLWKAHVFWYLIYKSIGFEGWQKLHNGLAAGSYRLDNSRLKSSLEGSLRGNPTSLFTGWVYPGKGKFDPAGALLDTDQDGIFDLDEQLLGTNPLSADSDGDSYTDYAEIIAGYNPQDKKAPEQGVILIDGDFRDWDSTYIVDVDNTQDGGKYDLYTLKYVWDKTNHLFFLNINFFKPLFYKDAAKKEAYYTQIYFDTDNDRETDYRLVIWSGTAETQGWAGFYQYEKEPGNSFNSVKKPIVLQEGAVTFKTGEDCLEIAMPMSLLTLTRPSLFAVMIDGGQETRLDKFDSGWIKIVPVLPYPERPKQVWIPGHTQQARTVIK